MKKIITIMCVLTTSICMLCSCGTSNKKNSAKQPTKETIENSDNIQNESASDDNNSNKDNSNENESLTDNDYLYIYDDLLFNTYKFIVGMNEETEPSDDQVGIFEALRGEAPESALLKAGYCIKDLSGDGIPELLIFQIDEKDSDSYIGSRLLAAYTYKDNAPLNIFVGTSRNRYYLFDDNTIFNEGSNGAAYTIFGTYNLSKDGSELVTKDFYFTSPINDDYSNIGFFHNTNGDLDSSKSKEYKGSEDDFWKVSTDLSAKITSYEVAPFEVFHAGPDDVVDTKSLPVSGVFIEDTTIDINLCHQFVADTSGYEVQIVLSATEKITNFQFNSLEYIESSDNESVDFLMTPMYSLDELTSDKPLVVTLTFFGTIPSYGISYTDANGTERKFFLEVSGMDGSLLVTEY